MTQDESVVNEAARSPGTSPESCPAAASARKPHIVVVGHAAGCVLAGAERSLLDIIAAVDRSQFELSCILPEINADYLKAIEEHTRNIAIFRYEWGSGNQKNSDATARFAAYFTSKRADIVHVNTITLMDPLIAARRVNVPSIVHARELIDHDDELAAILGEDPMTIVRAIQDASDYIVANSDATHRLYRKRESSFRLYNCVSLDAFDVPNVFEPGKLKVGIISNNLPRKGIQQFVDLATLAGRTRPAMEFVVIGPRNRDVERLERSIQGSDPPVNLRFLDYIPNAVQAISQVNVVLSLSIVPESFGRTIAEAMAARRPVIAYRWGATPELVRHGVDGFLVSYLDIAGVLEHLVMLADHPDRAAEMGRNGRMRAQELFAPESFAAGLNGIYRRILDARRAQAPISS